MIYLSFVALCFVSLYSWTDAFVTDDYHCKVPTCRDFHYGLRHNKNYARYEDTCYETVFALQSIPSKYGKCIDGKGKLNPPCIHELARTIRKCISEGLYDLPEQEARHYCGYTLMKYCAIHVGLDRFPLVSKLSNAS